MWTVSNQDFNEIKSWGLEKNPFAAVEDFSEMKKELRWLNPENRKAYVDYIHKRVGYIGNKNFDNYYKEARKPIDKERWQYLMDRKAWFIMPLGWENIAAKSCTVADFGCGDGDTVQRLVNFLDQNWKKNGITNRKVHVVGIDLNESRIENARKLVSSNNPNITTEFHVGDIVGKGLNYKNNEFDFALCTGVLEILEDEPCAKFLNEMCRVVGQGIYIEDLFEEFPGGYPRGNLSDLLAERGFKTEERHVIFSEPFDVEKLKDPKRLWPILLDQNIWAIRSN